MRILTSGTGALIALLLLAAPATAGTVHVQQGYVTFEGDAVTNEITVVGIDDDTLEVRDTAVDPTVEAGSESNCAAIDDVVTCDGVPLKAAVFGDGGDDVIEFSGGEPVEAIVN